MTTLKELGEMLIEVADNGRTMQFKAKFADCWQDKQMKVGTVHFDMDVEYRLKPKIETIYYRAYKDGSTPQIRSSTTRFKPWDEVNFYIEYADYTECLDRPFANRDQVNWDEVFTHIHDFEVES